MPRSSSTLARPKKYRDAKRIIIATEDSKATPAYFEAVKIKYENASITVELVGDEKDTDSAPEHVIKRLDEYYKDPNNNITACDELWLVIDVDRWGDGKLSDIVQQCVQKNYAPAVSNPAIEIWFLLHLTALDVYDNSTQNELLANKKTNDRNRLEQEIISKIGKYNKSNFDAISFLKDDSIYHAVNRAEQLDTKASDRWPQELGTHVYKLAKSILGMTLETKGT